MKRIAMPVLVYTLLLQAAMAATWESSTGDCSIELPPGNWTTNAGGETSGFTLVLQAADANREKGLVILKSPMANSISLKDPQLVQGLKEGFGKKYSRITDNGYTNIDGRLVYWFAGDKDVDGTTVSILVRAYKTHNSLYTVYAESYRGSPGDDAEFMAAIDSFTIDNAKAASELPGAMSIQIGRWIGRLLVALTMIGILVILLRQRKKA